MTLRGLVLPDVIDQHFQAAVDAAVIEVEPEPAHFDRLSAALMLAGVDSGVQLMKDLVVTGEQGLLEDFRVAAVRRWVRWGRR